MGQMEGRIYYNVSPLRLLLRRQFQQDVERGGTLGQRAGIKQQTGTSWSRPLHPRLDTKADYGTDLEKAPEALYARLLNSIAYAA